MNEYYKVMRCKMGDSDEQLSALGRLKAGIAGAGLMGRWHAHAITGVGSRVVAVMDIDAQAAHRLASHYRSAKSFSNFEEMLKYSGIDVLHVCTPPSTHYRVAELAIEAGVHVLIEKPLTPCAKETRRLYTLAGERGLSICPVHQFLFQEGVLKAKRLLSRIGEIVHMAGTFCSAGGSGRTGSELDEVAAEILVHPLSLLQSLLPGGLMKHGWTSLRPRYGELIAYCKGSGVSLSILISMNARPTECSFKILGTKGVIHLDLYHGYAFVESGKVSKARKIGRPFIHSSKQLSSAALNLAIRTVKREPAYPGLRRLIRSFYESVRGGEAPPISPKDTTRIAEVRDHLTEITGVRVDRSRALTAI